MSENDKTTEETTDENKEIRDPKEAMREALEAKKKSSHASAAAGPQGEGKLSSGSQQAANSQRLFRRKSGG